MSIPSLTPVQQPFPTVPSQQPQAAPAAPAASPLIPKEAISALYKDTLSTFVEYKMKEAAYQQMTGQSPVAALGQVGNNPFESSPSPSPIPVSNTPQIVGPVPPEQPQAQPQPEAQAPSFMPGQTPPPPQVEPVVPQV